MVIEWTKSARQDLYDYYIHSHIYNTSKLILYIKELVQYVNILSSSPYLGKIIFYMENYEIRQIIYKKHRILYSIKNNKINILVVVHIARDLGNLLKYIKNN